MNAPAASPIVTIPEVIGTPFGGGFYAGRYLEGDQLCLLIVAPKSLGEHADTPWSKKLVKVAGSLSYADGFSNTRAMAEAGSDIAQWALGLDINGESDWFIPARDQLELLYRAFKPTDRENWVFRNGDNPSSVPPGYPYTEAFPACTTIPGFCSGAADAFDPAWYWSSTQYASNPDFAWCQSFDGGNQNGYHKNGKLRVRAVRRLKI
jgi:hypothetical protein